MSDYTEAPRASFAQWKPAAQELKQILARHRGWLARSTCEERSVTSMIWTVVAPAIWAEVTNPRRRLRAAMFSTSLSDEPASRSSRLTTSATTRPSIRTSRNSPRGEGTAGPSSAPGWPARRRAPPPRTARCHPLTLNATEPCTDVHTFVSQPDLEPEHDDESAYGDCADLLCMFEDAAVHRDRGPAASASDGARRRGRLSASVKHAPTTRWNRRR
jgi:hypothetical protein